MAQRRAEGIHVGRPSGGLREAGPGYGPLTGSLIT